ncbi:lauroyl acyltransferase [Formicincola oecophyllae]|uniref:Lauroyl acyltransferase n=1 Tax=Formicincola oecophyllae TaxID=2558361 RepID=A0A4Y6U9U8_9PROT|nr:lauroyl acyltransferase [Formicincola oecophyllae]
MERKRPWHDKWGGWALAGALGLLRAIPPGVASRCGAMAGAVLGQVLPGANAVADTNLALAFPGKGRFWRAQMRRAMWRNLGATLGEFPHIGRLAATTARVKGAPWLRQALASGRNVVFFSGHVGNWELLPPLVARHGLAFAPFYRAPNNPHANSVLCFWRQRALMEAGVSSPPPLLPKGRRGAALALRYMASGGHVGVLGDQKMNDGIKARLFGRDTMTAPAAAALALRFDALIITGHVERTAPACLTLHVDRPLDPRALATTNQQERVACLTQALNDRLEGWVRQRPGDWLWLHRRWEKRYYQRLHL